MRTYENNLNQYHNILDTQHYRLYFPMIRSKLSMVKLAEELFLNQDDFLAFSHRLNLMTYQALEDFAAWFVRATRGRLKK